MMSSTYNLSRDDKMGNIERHSDFLEGIKIRAHNLHVEKN